MVVRAIAKAIAKSVGMTLATLLVAACDVQYPRGVVGQVLTNDNRADVLCTLSLYEALDTAKPILISTARIVSGNRFRADLKSKNQARTASSKLWVYYDCDGYYPRVRGFDAEHLSVWEERVVDLGVVTVDRWRA